MAEALKNILDSTPDFYYVGYEGGELVVRPYGYIYCAHCSVTDDPEQIYRWEEYDRLAFTLEELRECGFDYEETEKYECRRGDLMEDLTYEQACAKLLEMLYEMGSSRHELPLDSLEDGVEPGLYCNGSILGW